MWFSITKLQKFLNLWTRTCNLPIILIDIRNHRGIIAYICEFLDISLQILEKWNPVKLTKHFSEVKPVLSTKAWRSTCLLYVTSQCNQASLIKYIDIIYSIYSKISPIPAQKNTLYNIKLSTLKNTESSGCIKMVI